MFPPDPSLGGRLIGDPPTPVRFPIVYANEWCDYFYAGVGPPLPEPPQPPNPDAPPADAIPVPDMAALQAVLADPVGNGGKSYLLAPGDWGQFTSHSTVDFTANPITIYGTLPDAAAAGAKVAPGAPGTWFYNFDVWSMSGVTFKNFNVDGPNTCVTLSWCNDLTFKNVTANCTTRQGNGWAFDTCSYISIIGQGLADQPDVSNVGNVFSASDCDHITIKDFTYADWGPDGILWAGCTDCMNDGILGYDSTLIPGEHPDLIQGFISSRTQAICERITIQNSGYLREAGMESQGFFFEWANGLNYLGNYTFGTMYNAMSISGGTAHLINDNFCYSFPDYGTRIGVGDGAIDAHVTNNLASILNSGAGAGFIDSGNDTTGTAGPANDYTTLDPWLAAHPNARRRPTASRTRGGASKPIPERNETPDQRKARIFARQREIWETAFAGRPDTPPA
jgi:hypothetical protein